MNWDWRLYLLCALFLCSACGRDTEFTPVKPPSGSEAKQALFESSGERAALPGGLSVPQEDVDFVLKYLQGESEQAVVEGVALRKRIAEEAIEQGIEEDFDVRMAYAQAMAQAMLKQQIEEDLSPDDIPIEQWEAIFRRPNVRPWFDHNDLFFVVDVQSICCVGRPIQQCKRMESFHRCMEERGDMMPALREILAEQSFETPKHLADFMRDKKESDPVFSTVAVEEYKFQYDFSVPHDQQGGHTVFSEAVASSARSVADNLMTPARAAASPYGWHIVFVTRYVPERHLSFGDPDVLPELQDRHFPEVQLKQTIDYANDLGRRYGIRINQEAFDEVDWARASGLRP